MKSYLVLAMEEQNSSHALNVPRGSERTVYSATIDGVTAKSGRGYRGVFSRYWPHFVAVILFGVLVYLSSYLWLEAHSRFPRIEPGTYIGTLTMNGLEAGRPAPPAGNSGRGEQPATVLFYLERLARSNELFVAVLSAGWTPQMVSAVARDGDNPDAEWVLPLLVSGPERRLKLTGGGSGARRYQGQALDLSSGEEGRWDMHEIGIDDVHAASDAIPDMRLWLLLRDELARVERSIEDAQTQIPQQKIEIERLTQLVSSGDELRNRANQKYETVRAALVEAQERLAEKQRLASELEDKLVLALRVTGMGRLVSLSRESLARESRWIDSMLRGETPEESEEFRVELNRADRVRELQRAIQAERATIDELELSQANGGAH